MTRSTIRPKPAAKRHGPAHRAPTHPTARRRPSRVTSADCQVRYLSGPVARMTCTVTPTSDPRALARLVQAIMKPKCEAPSSVRRAALCPLSVDSPVAA